MPDDAAHAFLAYLLEDMADEWGTKAMFHYRWYRERDQKQMSEWLVVRPAEGQGPRDDPEIRAAMFRARQVGRMALVGCTPENAPIIEESARRIMALFEAHVTEEAYPLRLAAVARRFRLDRPAHAARRRSDAGRSDARRFSVHLPLARRIWTMRRASRANGAMPTRRSPLR